MYSGFCSGVDKISFGEHSLLDSIYKDKLYVSCKLQLFCDIYIYIASEVIRLKASDRLTYLLTEWSIVLHFAALSGLS